MIVYATFQENYNACKKFIDKKANISESDQIGIINYQLILQHINNILVEEMKKGNIKGEQLLNTVMIEDFLRIIVRKIDNTKEISLDDLTADNIQIFFKDLEETDKLHKYKFFAALMGGFVGVIVYFISKKIKSSNLKVQPCEASNYYDPNNNGDEETL